MIVRATVAAVLAVLAAAGCSNGGGTDLRDAGASVDEDAPSVEASTVEAEVTTVPLDSEPAEPVDPDDTEAPTVTFDDGEPDGLDGTDLEAYIAGRYEAYWDAYDAARTTPSVNPSTDFPILADLAAGEQLEVSHESLIELAEKGEAIREPETPAIAGVDADAEHRLRVDLVDGSVAEISACVVNDDVRHIVGSGAIVRDAVTTVTSEATMAFTGGEWKLIRSRAIDIADGVTGCWLTADAEYPY
ncbi:MAG: hypothetical protein ACR2QO_11840 [Acidimicrobiales bacterium]